MWRFGIEHEVAFLDMENRFVDWTCASMGDLARIVDLLPYFAGDYPLLHRGDAGIRVKRWYIEGLERLDEAGELCAFKPKGIEIRTPPRQTIAEAIDDLSSAFNLLEEAAARFGYAPVLVSFNPSRSRFDFDPPLNRYEQELCLEEPDLLTDGLTILTYGPDLNLSRCDWAPADALDAARKLTAYSPFIVPWSFSAPFSEGRLWGGLSRRTFLRTGRRAAVRVWVASPELLLDVVPTLTKLARVPGEVGRVEFKACDSMDDPALYAALLALLKGLLCDTSLRARAFVPDASMHQRAALHGFDDPVIAEGTQAVLTAAAAALEGDGDAALLTPLRELLARQETPAHTLRRSYAATGDLWSTLRGTYHAMRSIRPGPAQLGSRAQ